MSLVVVAFALMAGAGSTGDLIGSHASAVQGGGMGMTERQLRATATAAPLPTYPRESLDAKAAGVAVAAVRFGLDGRTQSVEILEAPDSHIAAAVREAVSRWTIPGVQGHGRGEVTSVRGKLTFYFQLHGGKGRVVNPDEMPGALPAIRRPAAPARPTSGIPSMPVAEAPPAAPVVRGAHGEDLETISVDAFKKDAARAHIVLDIGQRDGFTRGHWPGAINIPFDELEVRSGIELPRDRPIVIDCTQEEIVLCRWGGGRLAEQQFTNVVLLVR